MKASFGNLVLLCLLAHALGDCQRDCLTCNIYQGDNFNTLVLTIQDVHRFLAGAPFFSSVQSEFDWQRSVKVFYCSSVAFSDHSYIIELYHEACVVECEGKAFPSGLWEVCSKLLGMLALPLNANSMEEDAYQPLAIRDSLFAGSLKRLDDLTNVIGLSKIEGEKRVSKISGVIHEREEEDGTIESRETPLRLTNDADSFGDPQGQPKDIEKRYGGFLKGKYSYRKFMDPVRGMQKRYGGFIGVRKSARKWNNQKRFSQFLKQYLSKSTRSSEYDSLSTDLNEQNEI